MRISRACAILLIVPGLTVTACARRTVDSTTTPAPESAGPVRWSGNLQPTQQRTGDIAPTTTSKAFGTVSLVPSSENPNRVRARITVSIPTPAATALRWAVLPGRCGAASLPLTGYEQFPVIEVGSNGRGQLDAEVPLTMPGGGTYHLNVYWEGHQLTEVLTCANLRAERGG